MNTTEIARIARLVGEPARTAMLLELMDGRKLTANELAQAGQVTPQTASRHLGLLAESGLLVVTRQGRHRYHALASAAVARVLDGITQLAAAQRARALRPPPPGPGDDALRLARTCHDHIGGRLGVAITEQLLAMDAIAFHGTTGRATDHCAETLKALGMDPDFVREQLAGAGRAACRPCMDWSERRVHAAGKVGALIHSHCVERGWLLTRRDSRVLEVTARGAAALRTWLGAQRWDKL